MADNSKRQGVLFKGLSKKQIIADFDRPTRVLTAEPLC